MKLVDEVIVEVYKLLETNMIVMEVEKDKEEVFNHHPIGFYFSHEKHLFLVLLGHVLGIAIMEEICEFEHCKESIVLVTLKYSKWGP